ncbi:uncharacterized protein BDR25DRAFT_35017 [Lindgomyces ingoldianus]|uniref:Uncharacterized protein n=1 Tax=Lindgomyces ingoldianus TaxID=673940 RepID=A0ACB6QU57_9PLEO|nr:uncharacterized protein BDR25DRAFT_35017 [Lindgomyces ingoldianus]KAF2470461.1 hypothetical protein BDR25DRAFT_35017 [Lindgomyces ingoldianus]
MADTTIANLSPAEQAQLNYRQLAAEHIRELSSVNERIPPLLLTSATALSTLTNAPISHPSYPHPPPHADTPAYRQSRFLDSAQEFFTSITSIRETLHAQINDLHDNHVIAAEVMKVPADTTATAATGGVRGAGAGGIVGGGKEKAKTGMEGITNGGMGSFDIGVLNTRARGGRIADGEVLARLERLVDGFGKEDEGEGMYVDG